jgi:hypothetical protein
MFLTSFLNRKEARLKPLAVKLSHRRASFAGVPAMDDSRGVAGFLPGVGCFFSLFPLYSLLRLKSRFWQSPGKKSWKSSDFFGKYKKARQNQTPPDEQNIEVCRYIT